MKLSLTTLLAGIALFFAAGTTSLSAEMKCGAGKCGAAMEKKAPMKCGAGKCGAAMQGMEKKACCNMPGELKAPDCKICKAADCKCDAGTKCTCKDTSKCTCDASKKEAPKSSMKCGTGKCG